MYSTNSSSNSSPSAASATISAFSRRMQRRRSRSAAGALIAGHLHPAARVLMNGRSVRRGCFVHDSRLMVMPAYGVSTGNLNILSPAFMGLFAWSEIKVTMMGRDRLYPVSPKRLVGG
jgi:metallophosphoesterase superfamily enzyme